MTNTTLGLILITPKMRWYCVKYRHYGKKRKYVEFISADNPAKIEKVMIEKIGFCEIVDVTYLHCV